MFLPVSIRPAKVALVCFLLALIPSLTFAQRPYGTDVSHFQPSINWTTVKTAGVTFAWAKATQSTGYTSPDFTTQEAGAKGVGIYIGAYHYAQPSSNPNITGANSADSEAAHFWAVAGSYIKNGGTNLVPMLDWEDIGMTNQLPASTLSAWVNEWCNSVSNLARGNGVLDLRPVVYTGTWYSAPSSTYSGLTTAVTNWPAWISSYPTTPDPQTGGPSSFFPWTSCYIWQYADTNWSGGDADVYNGNLNGFFTNFVVGGTTFPAFVAQPTSRTADQGGSLTLSATMSGTAPFSYQWRSNTVKITGATNSTFTLTNIQPNYAASYTLIVTNTSGATTSAVAVVTVNGLYTPVFYDNFETNSASSWTTNKSSTDTRVIFGYDYSAIGVPVAPHTTNGTTKGLRLEANLTAGAVAAVNVSPNGQSFSNNYRLHFDMWINVNGPLPAGGTSSTEMLTAGLGTAGNQVQWSSSGDGVWFTADGDGGLASTSTTQGDFVAYTNTIQLSPTNGAYAADITAYGRSAADIYYYSTFPGQAPPAFQTSAYPTKQTGSLKIGTAGLAWHDVVINKSGTNVYWFIDGLKIASVTNVTLAGNNIFVGYWDPFSSHNDNTNTSFGLVDNLRVEIPITAPAITTQPQSLAVTLTSNATFSVIATGSPAPAYQWYFGASPVAGATASAYVKTNIQTNDVGSYSVILTNLGGAITSSVAVLTINIPPTITNQPVPVTVGTGSNAVFTVQATGSSPTYQWRRATTNLTASAHLVGVTTTALTVVGVGHTDEDSYNVLVTNTGGTVTSADATLTGIDRPLINSITANQTLLAGQTAVFTVNATAVNPAYQWRKGAIDIVGAQSSSLTLTNISSADTGSYTVIVTNLAGSAPAGPRTLTVQPVVAPAITVITPTVNNTNLTLAATVTGTTPTCQWLANNSLLVDNAHVLGSATTSLTLIGATSADAGTYTLIATNSAGAATNTALFAAPVITTQPTNQTINLGANANFSVAATGLAPAYQWLLNTTNVTDATNTTLAITNAQLTQAGTYTVIVSNLAGSITSSNAVLQLVTLQFNQPTLLPDGTFQLNLTGAPGNNYLIETTTNLFSPWFTLAILTNTTGTIQFTTGAITNTTQRYFRLSAPK